MQKIEITKNCRSASEKLIVIPDSKKQAQKYQCRRRRSAFQIPSRSLHLILQLIFHSQDHKICFILRVFFPDLHSIGLSSIYFPFSIKKNIQINKVAITSIKKWYIKLFAAFVGFSSFQKPFQTHEMYYYIISTYRSI